MARPRLRPGWFPIHRDAVRAFASLSPQAFGTLVRLMAECDDRTGTITASVRRLAIELGYRRETLLDHLHELERTGAIEIDRAVNQHGAASIRLLNYPFLRGGLLAGGAETGPAKVGGAAGGPVGGAAGGPESAPANRPRRAGTKRQNEENEKNEEKKSSPLTPQGGNGESVLSHRKPPIAKTKPHGQRSTEPASDLTSIAGGVDADEEPELMAALAECFGEPRTRAEVDKHRRTARELAGMKATPDDIRLRHLVWTDPAASGWELQWDRPATPGGLMNNWGVLGGYVEQARAYAGSGEGG